MLMCQSKSGNLAMPTSDLLSIFGAIYKLALYLNLVLRYLKSKILKNIELQSAIHSYSCKRDIIKDT